MTRSNSIQFAILAWIVAILFSIASGPMMKMCFSVGNYPNNLDAHKKLQNLNINISSDFGGIKNTTELFFACLASFLACVLGLSILLTIFTICQERFYRKILYPVFLSLFSTAIGLTIGSIFLSVKLFDAQINPSETSNFHGQMIASLEGKYSSDNFTTGTRMSNDWNHLFINFECCGVNKVVGTSNDFDLTPWCTTKGSCQATASQIPKTCCKGFTEYDYQNAPTKCHSSVDPGQYYDKGCYSVMKKEVIKERIRLNSFTDDILTEVPKVILVMGSCSLLSLVGVFVFIGMCLKRKVKETRQTAIQRE